MRILMVEHSGKGGMYSYTDALCSGLSQAGADITVLSSPHWPEENSGLFKVERILPAYRFEQARKSSLHWAVDRICRSIFSLRRRNRYALEGDFDVIHIQGARLPLLDQYFLRPLKKSKPVVLTVHDIEPHYRQFVNRDSFLRRNLQIPDRLIVHYKEGMRRLIEKYALDCTRIDMIPHGIMPLYNSMSLSEARRVLQLPAGRPIILFFGHIRPNKGLDVLLNALQIIRKFWPDVLMLIAGEPPRNCSYEPYSQIIQKLNLSGNIRSFINFIPPDEADIYFSASDAVILPYKKFESQSGVLLRAYAHKKPVVVSNTGAMAELVSTDKTGLVVEAGNVQMLSEAVSDVLDKPEKYRAGYTPEIVTMYDWKNIAKLTIQSYQKAIESRL